MRCPYCGYEKFSLNNKEMYPNISGSICIQCQSYIPPDKELKIVAENKLKKIDLKNKLIKYLRNKALGDKNGNKFE